eukprot:1160080-Pelagomonas_calceolata.AAC.8
MPAAATACAAAAYSAAMVDGSRLAASSPICPPNMPICAAPPHPPSPKPPLWPAAAANAAAAATGSWPTGTLVDFRGLPPLPRFFAVPEVCLAWRPPSSLHSDWVSLEASLSESLESPANARGVLNELTEC